MARWWSAVSWAAVALVVIARPAVAAPAYDQGRLELEAALAQMIEQLPGSWDSFPQIYQERTQRMPPEGEHEYWHRTFAYIKAPQVGEHVFYGQINVNEIGRAHV